MPDCKILAVRVVGEQHFSAVCRVVDGEVQDWPYTRPPTHCIGLPE